MSMLNQMNNNNYTLDLFNDFTLFIEMVICTSIMAAMVICFASNWSQNLLHWNLLELVWSVLPALVLVGLGFPSIKLLYMTEMYNFFSLLTLKVVGHQWYWEYSLPEFKLNLEAYPLEASKMFRLAETSDLVILPWKCSIRVLISSLDVLHSWAIPSLGVKMDACPGRLNFLMINISKPGVYVGQCSELCGALHHFMPIYVEVCSFTLFMEWMKSKI